MARSRVLTDFDILEIARRAVERRREKRLQRCMDFVNRWGERYVKKYLKNCASILEDPYSYNKFLKADFIVCARTYLKENNMIVKIETLLRRLRKLAEYQQGIKYVDKRKGIYEIIS